MELVVGLLVLAGFCYFVYRQMSKPKATGTGNGGGGVKPDDHVRPDKK